MTSHRHSLRRTQLLRPYTHRHRSPALHREMWTSATTVWKTYTFGSEAAMTTQLAVCEPRAGAHAEPALRPGVEEPLRGGWRRATLRDAQGSRGGRGPTGAAGRGPKRAAEANGQVRRHVDAAARPVVGAEPVLCANRRPLAERSSTTGSPLERILPDCGTRTVGHGRTGVVRMVCWRACGVGRAGKLHQWPRAAGNSCRKRAGRSQLSRTAAAAVPELLDSTTRNCWTETRRSDAAAKSSPSKARETRVRR